MDVAPTNPSPGDFFVVSIKGRIGQVIHTAEELNGDGSADFEHAAVYIGGGFIVEAQPGGAIKTSLSKYDGRAIVWSSGVIPLDATQRSRVVTAALRYLGTPYSFLDYLGLLLARFGLRPRWLKRYIASTGHMICSQLVDQCYQDAGVQLFADGRIPGDVTPADLYNLINDIQHMDWVGKGLK